MSTLNDVPSYSEGLKELRGYLNSALPSKALQVFDRDAEELGTSINRQKIYSLMEEK